MRITPTTALLAAFAFAAATTAACSSDDPEATTTATNPSGTGGSGQGGSTTSAGGSSTTTGTGGEGPMCDAPRPAHPGNNFPSMGVVSATFTLPEGGFADNLKTDLCGTNICLEAVFSDTNGAVSIDGNGSGIDDPALLFGEGKEYGRLAVPVTSASMDFGEFDVLPMPAINTGSQLAEGDNTNSGVTLTIPSGSDIDVDGLIYMDPSEATFRVFVQDTASITLPALDPTLNLELILAMAPVDTVICPGAALSFPNQLNWTDGAEVELFVHGTLIGSHYAPYTQWAKVAEAVVQGNEVVTKDGESIELIATYGARLKP